MHFFIIKKLQFMRVGAGRGGEPRFSLGPNVGGHLLP